MNQPQAWRQAHAKDAPMRLADFILANTESIVAAWENFARSIWPAALNDPTNDPATLRDHAEQILYATVEDIKSDQTPQEQSAKSKGEAHESAVSARLNRASLLHGSDRVHSGFELAALVAEYRALRASVLQLWRESGPVPDLNDLDDVTRFNESIDQSLTEAVRSFTEQVQRDRQALLDSEQAARKDAESANCAKDNFLATLSHEMRTPLSAIVGWISILRSGGNSEAVLTEGLEVIERNTKAQVQLIEDVLDVSRIVSGKFRLDIHDCDLTKTIKAGIDAVRPAAAARDITLDVQLDSSAARASCDAIRIQQVVWNLLTNAIKFTPDGGIIRVTLDRERSAFRIAVSDNGQGISPELLPYVFERFRQADSSTKRRFGGLGLGLSLVKHISEMHGGTVEALSAGEGHGSTFVVRLPIQAVLVEETDKEDAPDGDSSPMPPVRLDGIHVLVVDDEADARRILAMVLEGVGARVTTAASASDALAAIDAAIERKDGPHFLVSDIGMPDQDGYDLIRQVRHRGHAFPAIALTAFARVEDAREAASAGFQVHIAKPINISDLTAVIARLAAQKK